MTISPEHDLANYVRFVVAFEDGSSSYERLLDAVQKNWILLSSGALTTRLAT